MLYSLCLRGIDQGQSVLYITALLAVEDRERLLKEVTLMVDFSHPNIMPLIGFCLDQETPLIIMPFMSKGNILQYVREHKENLYLTESSNTEQVMIQNTSDCTF